MKHKLAMTQCSAMNQ